MAVENPPAFPANIGLDGSIYEGMSLRDWFAGQAITICVKDCNKSYEAWAIEAYALADAMLAARKDHDNERY